MAQCTGANKGGSALLSPSLMLKSKVLAAFFVVVRLSRIIYGARWLILLH